MNLCAPTIVGPLSELSKSIRVQGQLAGSTVTISSIGPNPRTVAKKSSLSSSDERIGLLPGVTLNQKDLLIAVQAFGGGGVHLIVVPIDYSENTRVLVNELRDRLAPARS